MSVGERENFEPANDWNACVLSAATTRKDLFTPCRATVKSEKPLTKHRDVAGTGVQKGVKFRYRHPLGKGMRTRGPTRRSSSSGGGSAELKQLQLLMAVSTDGVIACNRSGRILAANDAAATLLGLPASDLAGASFAQLLKSGDRPPGRARRTSGTGFEQLVTLERPDGSRAEIGIRRARVGSSRVYIRFLRDFTVENAMAEAFRKKARILAEAESVGRVGGWELDTKTGRLSWTPELRRILEVPRHMRSVSVEASYRFYTPESRRIVERAYKEAITHGRSYDLELEVVTARGNHRWVREVCHATVRRGRVASLIGVLQDITERRQVNERIAEIAERERARLGADLHDGLGQELAGLRLLLESAVRRADAQHSTLAADLRRLAEIAGKAAKSARTLAHGMMPVEFSESGLTGALTRLAESTTATSGAAVTVRVRGTQAHLPTGRFAETLYRVVQEATNNAVKHGHAKRIWVSLIAGAARVVVLVSNDGAELNATIPTRGMGLKIMRRRSEMHGGALSITVTHAGRTRVRCVLPHPGGSDVRRLIRAA